MWVLITKLQPPQPPQPQVPPTLALPPNPTWQDYENLVNLNNTPVSYCALLMDPNVTDYNWVDQELRQEIYDCMYHNPSDRPPLNLLLTRAKLGAGKSFPGEDDGYIRRWISRWL